MTSELDLWTGTVAETGDDVWMAYTYADDAVQFIHTENHTQIWQGRTVVGEGFNRGRVEAHYSHSEDAIMLVAATGHDRPPEQERILDGTEFAFQLADLDEPTCEVVLRTLLAEWVVINQIASPTYPDQSELDKLEPLTTNATEGTPEHSEPTGQEIFNAGVATIKSGNAPTGSGEPR